MASGAENDLGDVDAAGAFQLTEEQTAPEDADEGVGVPERKCDGETDVANGEDGKGVGHGPQHTGQDRHGDEMRCLATNRRRPSGAFEERGNGPARGEDARDHAERDGEGGQAGVDELGGRLGRAEPYTRSKAAHDADAVHRFEDGLGIGAGRCAHASPCCFLHFRFRTVIESQTSDLFSQ